MTSTAALTQADDDALRARIEEGLASSLFLMRTELAAAADHARVAAVLAERTGDRDTQIAALTEQALIDAVTGGTGWRAIVEPGRSLEQRVEPVPVVASATFCLAVVLAWVEKVCDLAELRYERIQEART